MTWQKPILIGGAGSSGSSLLRVLLDRHSSVAAGPELSLFNKELFYSYPYDKIRKSAERIFKKGMCTEGWASYPRTFRRFLQYGWTKKELLHCIERCSSQKELVDCFFERYLRLRGKKIWVEKTPSNAYCFSNFLELYPRGKVIHIYRDGRDSVASLIKRGIDPYYATMAWLYNTASAIKLRGCPQYIEIKYESLVSDPKRVLKQLCDFLEIDFEDEMLDLDSQNVQKKVSSWHNSPYSAISKSSIGKHRSFFSPFDWFVFYSVRISSVHVRKYNLPCNSTDALQKILGYKVENRGTNRNPHIYKIKLLKLYLKDRITRFIRNLRIDKKVRFYPGSIKL